LVLRGEDFGGLVDKVRLSFSSIIFGFGA